MRLSVAKSRSRQSSRYERLKSFLNSEKLGRRRFFLKVLLEPRGPMLVV